MATVSMLLWRFQQPIRTVDRVLVAPFSTRHNKPRKRRDLPPRKNMLTLFMINSHNNYAGNKQRKLPFTRIALSRFNQEEQVGFFVRLSFL